MFYRICSIIVLLILLSVESKSQKTNKINKNKTGEIVIAGDVPSFLKPRKKSLGNVFSEIELYYSSIETPTILSNIKTLGAKVIDGKIKWTIPSDTKVIITSEYWGITTTLLLSPGDSIYISYNDQQQRVYSGRGAEKCKLTDEIAKLKTGMIRPAKRPLDIKTLEEFLKLNRFYDEQLAILMPYIAANKGSISDDDFNWIKAHTIEDIEIERVTAFEAIATPYSYNGSNGKSTLTKDDLTAIWDSTQYKPWALWLRKQTQYQKGGCIYICEKFNRQESWRKNGFYLKNDSLNSSSKRRWVYYNNIKKTYRGLMREKALAYIVANEVIKELLKVDDPLRVAILKDYYQQPGFPEYKQLVKEYELKSLQLRGGKWAPNFKLTDSLGNTYVKENFKGKTVILDFWFTGCKGCIQMTPKLREVEKVFEDDTNVVFLSISVDKDRKQWLNSVKKKEYKLDRSVNLFTGGEGVNSPMIKNYNIISYPELFIIGPDSNGTIVTHPVPDPRKDDGAGLIALIKNVSAKGIKEHISDLYDGPYVVYKGDSIFAYGIENDKVYKKALIWGRPVITTQTDVSGKTFSVSLKEKLEIEASVYPQPEKVLAISDIEGNFDAFRRLLIANKVIDEQFNWVFDKGHLILNGDFFDRGNQVVECLWLIYSLEEKARSKGGYVHFILGNHEIMNMQGDYRYVQKKYIDNARKMGLSYSQLFDEKTELGKWLRTKNIMEKIGDVLYVHAGISPQVNRMALSIAEINDLVRPHYAGKIDSSNSDLVTLFDAKDAYPLSERPSPFWFRGYYNSSARWKSIPTHKQVDSTLTKFGVNKIVTGHTIVDDAKVTFHYDGKVINIDTRHAKRDYFVEHHKSAALLIDHSNYYNVDIDGNKEALFDTLDASRSTTSSKK